MELNENLDSVLLYYERLGFYPPPPAKQLFLFLDSAAACLAQQKLLLESKARAQTGLYTCQSKVAPGRLFARHNALSLLGEGDLQEEFYALFGDMLKGRDTPEMSIKPE
ncbi:hypothetical protein GOP47_0030866 [Adiantum capillus-veneris]|nr:hypothetical protein GOP47_0030866 [Adiantum capillus-veneris]